MAQHGDLCCPDKKKNSDIFEVCLKVVRVVCFNGTAVPWRSTEVFGASFGKAHTHGILIPDRRVCATTCGLISFFTPTEVSCRNKQGLSRWFSRREMSAWMGGTGKPAKPAGFRPFFRISASAKNRPRGKNEKPPTADALSAAWHCSHRKSTAIGYVLFAARCFTAGGIGDKASGKTSRPGENRPARASGVSLVL